LSKQDKIDNKNKSSLSSHLKCLYTNATSLNNKFQELTIEIIQNEASIVFISETWWSDTSSTNIVGFNLFRSDRDGRGGGVCIFIKNNFKSYIIDDEFLNSRDIEQTWCIVEIGSEKIICGCIYRPGSSNKTENLAKICSIKQVSSFYSKKKCTGILLCGDFNYSSINWFENYNLLQNENDIHAKDFIGCLNDNFLYQNIVKRTFQVKTGCESNVLDLIITECENRIFLLKHLPPLGGIEHGHHVITFNYSYLNSPIEKFTTKKKLLYNRGDYEKLNDYFEDKNWCNEFLNLTANDSYNKWLKIYNNGCDWFIPIFNTSNSKRIKDPLWMDKEIKGMCRRKRKL
jgi:hypothetical protein